MTHPVRDRKILIVDTEQAIRDLLVQLLCPEYTVDAVGSAAEAVKRASTGEYAIVIAERELPKGPHSDVLADLRSAAPCSVLLLMSGDVPSGEPTVNDDGVFGLLRKPFDIEHVERTVGRAIEYRRRQGSMANCHGGGA